MWPCLSQRQQPLRAETADARLTSVFDTLTRCKRFCINRRKLPFALADLGKHADTIGFKIFGIAVGLLALMSSVTLLNMRMTGTVDALACRRQRELFPGAGPLPGAGL